MSPPNWLHFFQRPFPSANMVLIKGKRPILFDTGFGSDLARTERLLHEAGTPPQTLSWIVNSHYHCDHVGGNSGLQQRYGIPIAAFHSEAEQINRRLSQACDADWLDQLLEPYNVDLPLHEGDEFDTGDVLLRVLHTPGHTSGHISLYAPEQQILICGDVVHRNDVAWLNPFTYGPDVIDQMLETVAQLASLPVRWACSGHGRAIDQPQLTFERAKGRYERWKSEPQSIGWHACKRIFAYALMLYDGLDAEEVPAYLLRCAWFEDYSRHLFEVEPADFVEPLLTEMTRSGAAAWQKGRLIARMAHHTPAAEWLSSLSKPKDWLKGTSNGYHDLR